ncbi:hypothetical protein EBU94_05680 [bacterium]|nr:hypothetical protein [bacterium]
MKGRKFINLSTNEIVEVKDSFEDIAILEGNGKIRASRLLDPNYFEPFIDPTSFIKNESLLNDFANKLMQIPLENLKDDEAPINYVGERINVSDEPAILPYDPAEEERELRRKYNMPQQNVEVVRQNEIFAKYMDEEGPQIIERDPSGVVISQNIASNYQPQIQKQEDPIITMFRNCKRTLSFKLDLSVNEKIPRKDFIEMMEDSYTTSIIDYLADEFTNKLLSDPSEIKRRIKDEIVKIVYPKKVTPKPTPKATQKTTNKKTTPSKTETTKPTRTRNKKPLEDDRA